MGSANSGEGETMTPDEWIETENLLNIPADEARANIESDSRRGRDK